MGAPVANDQFCYTPATELAAMIRKKEASPVEIVEAFLVRIETGLPERQRRAAQTTANSERLGGTPRRRCRTKGRS